MSGHQAPSSPYLELLKVVLTDYYPEERVEYFPLPLLRQTRNIKFLRFLDRIVRTRNFALTKIKKIPAEVRSNGYDWPAQAYTMIGIGRLNNIESCLRILHKQEVPGDLVETGVWRGGAVMFMKAVLNELSITNRCIWAADTFNGFPKPEESQKKDVYSYLRQEEILKVSLKEVKGNFKRFNLLDKGVRFLEGEFSKTLPKADIQNIALLRLDADLYHSTQCVLRHLYPKVSPGGFVIVDDYFAFEECKQAVDEYRTEHKIVEPLTVVDKEAVFWQKSKGIS